VAILNDVGEQHVAGIAHGRIAEGFRRAGHQVVWKHMGWKEHSYDVGTSEAGMALHRWLSEFKPDLAIIGSLHGARADPFIVATVARACAVFWMLYDYWPLTGRCAHPKQCMKYKDGCDHTCPTPHEYPSLGP